MEWKSNKTGQVRKGGFIEDLDLGNWEKFLTVA
jgi:hypothetical protein